MKSTVNAPFRGEDAASQSDQNDQSAWSRNELVDLRQIYLNFASDQVFRRYPNLSENIDFEVIDSICKFSLPIAERLFFAWDREYSTVNNETRNLFRNRQNRT